MLSAFRGLSTRHARPILGGFKTLSSRVVGGSEGGGVTSRSMSSSQEKQDSSSSTPKPLCQTEGALPTEILEENKKMEKKGKREWWTYVPGSIPDAVPSEGRWWWDRIIICTVFAIAGSSTSQLKPLLTYMGLEGSMIEGPWSYRIGYVLVLTPAYSVILLTLGALSGRLPFFKTTLLRIWGRFLPKSLLDRLK
eukprot:TRINITY_DN4565_c0_g2_i9.p1 TRINITY_DN4565_c0_g2~~TRINITY_DN4565_c0_g2_i9.p1  ORF type:complete len:194 (-),score=45.45 TRINITY_DN4565_c0_g2_i9:92-673(-)